jgi:hypothetical protein
LPHPGAREHSAATITGPFQAQQTLAGLSPLDSDYMDDTPAKEETPAKDFNKLDLSQLQGFSFGTQWTQDKSSPSDGRERSDRPRREGGPDRREGGGPDRRDRRGFRRPQGSDFSGPGGGGAPSAPAGGAEAPRREYSDRGPRREYSGGPRRDGPGGERGPRFGGYGRGEPIERGPYDSPYFAVAFYPEDTSFNALAKTIRSSCRTIELFEIARTVIGKSDRFVVVLTRKPPLSVTPGGEPAAPTPAPAARQPIYLSVPDGIPFESEESALAHIFSNHLGKFFDLAEVEVEPPKGNFQVINKCGVTGELLGPPNYHRYAQIVQQHYNAKIARMPFEAYKSRIETVRDPEIVAQWLAKMKKTTRYTWKQSAKPVAASPVAVVPAATVATEPVTPATEAAVAEVAAQEGTTTPQAEPAITFDTFEDARAYLLSNMRDKVIRQVDSARFHGKLAEAMPQGEIRRAIEGALERQRRFPLDTANALRGRLRREHFTIFKKGSKGISYVCAVKRKFRVPGQTFSDSISALITYIEAFPMIRASELPKRFLNIDLPAPKATAPVEGAAPEPAAAEPVLTIDERAKISRMQGDLRWLVTEGYVTEFIDGRLFAPPPMVEARKKEVESEEHDPENFPEAPADPAPAAESNAAVVAPPPEAAAPSVAEIVNPQVTDAITAPALPVTPPEGAAPEPEKPAGA